MYMREREKKYTQRKKYKERKRNKLQKYIYIDNKQTIN